MTLLHGTLRFARAFLFCMALTSDRPDPLVVVVWAVGFVLLSAKCDQLAFEDGWNTCEKVCRKILGRHTTEDD